MINILIFMGKNIFITTNINIKKIQKKNKNYPKDKKMIILIRESTIQQTRENIK